MQGRNSSNCLESCFNFRLLWSWFWIQTTFRFSSTVQFFIHRLGTDQQVITDPCPNVQSDVWPDVCALYFSLSTGFRFQLNLLQFSSKSKCPTNLMYPLYLMYPNVFLYPLYPVRGTIKAGVTLWLDCLKPKITPAWVVIADWVDKVVNLSTLHTLVVGPKRSWFEDCIFQWVGLHRPECLVCKIRCI